MPKSGTLNGKLNGKLNPELLLLLEYIARQTGITPKSIEWRVKQLKQK